ncbi:uncharacterized protein B4U80_13591 [Leptotrombidium deliense]|uniref:Ig-like domain-containing protein n=1 Tax=Leptotrombidium deliense TaxID=299467 RepID=A0A443SVW5_9ACAR|nr:uncharacterized protein B4U80_13591 [Leptotrombidium deliense]
MKFTVIFILLYLSIINVSGFEAKLEIIPETVHYGDKVNLICHYDLCHYGKKLYDISFYKDNVHFMFYRPDGKIRLRIFATSGIDDEDIDLRKFSSQDSKIITLKRAFYSFSGNYSCVVTNEDFYKAESKSVTLTVVSEDTVIEPVLSSSAAFRVNDTLTVIMSNVVQSFFFLYLIVF